MTQELTPTETLSLTPERDAALACLARFGGNVSAASREMGVARPTMERWRDRFPERYVEWAEKLRDDREAQLIEGYNDVARLGVETARLGLSQALERLEGDEPVPNSDQIARNAIVVSGVATDKSRIWQDRPNQITAQSPDSVAEDLRALKEKAITVEVEDAS